MSYHGPCDDCDPLSRLDEICYSNEVLLNLATHVLEKLEYNAYKTFGLSRKKITRIIRKLKRWGD